MSRPLLAFAFCLLLPSTGQVQKYFGTAGVVLYLCVGLAALFAGYKYLPGKFLASLTERQVWWLVVTTFVALTAAFVVVYPLADAGIVGGGSDSEDALNVTATRLLQGRYPYYARTYLGNTVNQLPGAILLAMPFVLLGSSAYQDLFWLLAFFLAARWYLKDGRAALLLLWAVLALAPEVLQQVLTGGDHLANSLYVLLFTLLAACLIPQTGLPAWPKIASAVLLGVALSSRANFILFLPLLYSMLLQNAGWRTATKYMALVCAGLGAVTLPFCLYHPAAFAPLQTIQKVARFESVVPLAAVVIPLLAGVITLALSLQRMDGDSIVLLRNCAIPQAFLVLCVVALETLQAGKLELVSSGYGLCFLFPGALAAFKAIAPPVQAPA